MLKIGRAGLARLWNERFYCRGISGSYPDGRSDFPSLERRDDVTTCRSRDHLRRRHVFRHMLIAKEHPLYLLEVHAIGILQNAAHPYAWCQGIAAHSDPAAV